MILTLAVLHGLGSEGGDDWHGWAEVAWRYFQPGVGVNAETGLHYATKGWHRLTDWDLGVYVKAILDAEALGLIPSDAPWNSSHRLDRVLGFLETRPLTPDRMPHLQYDSETGGVPPDTLNRTAHPSDSARLLLALDELRRARPDLAPRVEEAVARHRFQPLAQSSYFSSNDIYPFYAAQGYHAFNLTTPQLRPLDELGDGDTVDVHGVQLPRARLTSEPLVLATLEERTSPQYRVYADRAFQAQQARYQETGRLTAFSEGSHPNPPYYAYEWIVTPKGAAWITATGGGEEIEGSPMVYTKIAFAYHAIYDNSYTRTLLEETLTLASDEGYLEGFLEDGEPLHILSDKTNGMILQAARYAARHKPPNTAPQ